MLLAETQRAFASAVRDAALAPPGSIERGRAEAHRLLRFNIYRNNSYVALVGAIAARFPAVARILGEEFFRATARVYAGAEPPPAALLDYGETFPAFLARFGPVADTPYLPSVARIEWACHAAYHARDAAPLSASAFAAAEPGPDAFLRLHPAVRVEASEYPIHTIWSLNADDGGDPAVELPAHGEALLVTRPGVHVEVTKIGLDAAAFIQAIADGRAIGEAYERTIEIFPGFLLEGALCDLLSAGAITGVSKK